MALQDVYFVAEIVGAAAIIGSLLFVGAQMRQNTNALKATVANDMVSIWQSVMEPFTNNPDFVEAMHVFRRDDPAQPPSENQITQVYGFWSPSFKNCEFAYYRYKAGEMDEGLWLAIRNGALAPFQAGLWTSLIWPGLQLSLSPQFVSFMEQLLADGEHYRIEDIYEPSPLL